MDAQVLIGFEGRAYQVRDFYCSQLLANILGGGMSSRLFQEVREKRRALLFGLCVSLGLFGFGHVRRSCGNRRRRSPELIPVILSELAKAAEGVDEQEINRSRAQVRSGLLMSQESPAARASQIARQMLLFGRPVSNDRTDGAA
jgi:predicted Zn-dependent peptidase